MRTRVLAAVAAAFIAPMAAAPSAMAGCGFLGIMPCKTASVDPATRTPGTAVAPVKQVNKAPYGTPNILRGDFPKTKVFGTPDAGVVPTIGDVRAKADDGAYVLYESKVDDRTFDMMVQSPGLQGAAPVRVTLPESWDPKSTRRYPVLYLLHGGGDPADYQCWTVYSDFYKLTKGLEAIIVMPSSGLGGHTTDYWNYGVGEAAGSQYLKFAATELPQILKRGYRAGDKAAVGGASSGARSALEVAWKRPGEYGAAAAYSGLLDTQIPGIAQTVELGPLASLQFPMAMWGNSILTFPLWTDTNPSANVKKLKNIQTYVSTGDGSQGPLDENFIIDPLEAVVNASTTSFIRAAQKEGIPLVADNYGKGVHQWQYFQFAFERSMPTLKKGMGLDG